MLEHKTILVTGSSRGIGAATARLAKKYRARVILHGKTDSEELRKLGKELDAEYLACEVAEITESSIARFGGIDILVNSAGINQSKTFKELTNDDWREIFETNVIGTVAASRAVIPGMLERGHGSIVNIASIKGYLHVYGKPAYAASKAAVMRLTSSMAEEFAPAIRINAIAPGFTDTDMTHGTLSPRIKEQIARIPLKRMAKPEEIAEAVLFLASDKATYITGQTLLVDGGLSVVG